MTAAVYEPGSAHPRPDFASDNSDFRALVKHTNAGARLCLVDSNWEALPGSVHKAIDKVTESIRPPLADSEFHSSIQRAAEIFKTSIQRQLKEHVTSKKAWTANQIATYTVPIVTVVDDASILG